MRTSAHVPSWKLRYKCALSPSSILVTGVMEVYTGREPRVAGDRDDGWRGGALDGGVGVGGKIVAAAVATTFAADDVEVEARA